MQKKIVLSEQEATLRQLLLEVSNYIGTLDGCTRPQLRITGGWVRDKILGVGSKDIDIGIDTMTGFKFGTLMNQYLEQPQTQAKYPKDMLGKLAKIEANPEKSKHLETITTKILGLEIDLVNLRKETYTDDSRNPQMEFGTPEDDALRRDATVNAMFYNLDTSEVEDFTGRGFEDMGRQVIKTPLSAYQTFKDDPLRVLRAIRFASRLGYAIDEEDKQAMADAGIREALKLKITRERVGIEVTKMLQGPDPVVLGPNPHQAFQLIDHLGLYQTIFSDPGSNSSISESGLVNWSRAYDQAQAFVTPPHTEDVSGAVISSIKSKLLGNPKNVYLMWLLCAFVPWARVKLPTPNKPSAKAAPSPAATAAREGIKADNNSVKVIENAVAYLADIIQVKDAAIKEGPPTTSPLKRKQKTVGREAQGMAIRRWGSNWRCSVMYAILTQITEASSNQHQALLEGYAAWLSELEYMDLLEVYQLKPLITGDRLAKALEEKPGPWMTKALEMVVAWQLRNPDESDAEAAISEVREKKKELGLG
ncbi:MAG: hypothetical protein Q9186_001802 [Xanthomendoza sp. 1 TL-2023]